MRFRRRALERAVIVKPGDYLAVIVRGSLTDQEREVMSVEIKRWWPGTRVVLLEGGADLKVFRPE